MTKRALITGATGGIGRAIAEALAPTTKLFLVGRNRDALDAICAGLPDATALAADLMTADGVASVAAAAAGVDVLVHSAGVLHMGTLEETTAAEWSESMELNVLAPVNLTRALLPTLRERAGHVFLINSGLGHRTIAGSGAYSASKFALTAFANALRLEEAEHGVRVTSIHPGRVATPMQALLHAWEGADYDPNRWVQPEQIAEVVLTALQLGSTASIDSIDVNPVR